MSGHIFVSHNLIVWIKQYEIEGKGCTMLLCICSFYFNLHRCVSARAFFSVQQDYNVANLMPTSIATPI